MEGTSLRLMATRTLVSPVKSPLRFRFLYRSLSTTSSRRNSPFGSGPAPPRLPEAEQKRFEELQRASTGAFSTPRLSVPVNQSPSTDSEPEGHSSTPSSSNKDHDKASELNTRVQADGQGEELHPNIRRGAPPEFEGEINPKTGEVGGPKNEPLRWKGDWSYNGRITDF
ncbi:MAG: hypothetical protein GOMPHAMPRED_005444 [Gomphillus americanus]|uniref:Succinate dehydrogenase assembly factor 4, mitochondrial n=1 Tax=Gomphillus americanus TaxID=1940652 RepID=A0A8H3IVE2_9LECA|nr:MAG: hypothetical protein GOMPHAMPRED_005444 [Gomphillus americanus]